MYEQINKQNRICIDIHIHVYIYIYIYCIYIYSERGSHRQRHRDGLVGTE